MPNVSGARALVAVIASAAVAVAAAAIPATARATSETNPDKQIYLKFQGSLTRIDWLGIDSHGHNFGKLTVKLSWDADAHLKDQADFAKGVDIEYTMLSGSIALDDSGDPSPGTSGLKSCSATLSERLSGYEQTVTTQYDLVTKHYELNEYQPPLTAYLLKSTDTSNDYCTVDPNISSAVGLGPGNWPAPSGDADYNNAWFEYDKFPGGHGPWLSTFADQWSRMHPAGDKRDVADITSTIEASDEKLPGQNIGPYLTKRILGEIKSYYGNDLKKGIQDAKPYCLNYLTGLGTFGAGVPVIGLGATLVGPVLVIAGAIVAAMAAPFCVAATKRVVDDYRINKDPPDRHITLLAQPREMPAVNFPGCGKYKASVRPDCKALTADAQRLVRVAQHLAAVDDAAAVTVNRYSTANSESNWAASAKQGKHLEALTVEAKKRLGALTSAGKRFATDLENRHLGWRFSKSADGRAIEAVLSLLAKKQLTRADLKPYAGTTLTPHKFDALRDQDAL